MRDITVSTAGTRVPGVNMQVGVEHAGRFPGGADTFASR
jgi:hypothetical protein